VVVVVVVVGCIVVVVVGDIVVLVVGCGFSHKPVRPLQVKPSLHDVDPRWR
jgi:hypothetical protein